MSDGNVMSGIRRFVFEAQGDPDTCCIVAVMDDGRLSISVSEEQAVDSYNAMFRCNIDMHQGAAVTLLDMLAKAYGYTLTKDTA